MYLASYKTLIVLICLCVCVSIIAIVSQLDWNMVLCPMASILVCYLFCISSGCCNGCNVSPMCRENAHYWMKILLLIVKTCYEWFSKHCWIVMSCSVFCGPSHKVSETGFSIHSMADNWWAHSWNFWMSRFIIDEMTFSTDCVWIFSPKR